MTGKNENDQNQEDLLSTALRYVLEELPPGECAEFERLLVERQAAREAVAEAVVLCQFGKHALDCVMEDARSAASWRPGESGDLVLSAPLISEPLFSATRSDRVWRIPAAWAAMAVAASIVAAVVLTGVRGNRFARKPMATNAQGGVAQGLTSVDAKGAGANGVAIDATASVQSDLGKRLAAAWLRLPPSPNEVALAADSMDAYRSNAEYDMPDDDMPVVDDESDILAGDFLAGDEEIIARVDSATSAGDWVFEAVTAEAATTAAANPQEG